MNWNRLWETLGKFSLVIVTVGSIIGIYSSLTQEEIELDIDAMQFSYTQIPYEVIRDYPHRVSTNLNFTKLDLSLKLTDSMKSSSLELNDKENDSMVAILDDVSDELELSINQDLLQTYESVSRSYNSYVYVYLENTGNIIIKNPKLNIGDDGYYMIQYDSGEEIIGGNDNVLLLNDIYPGESLTLSMWRPAPPQIEYLMLLMYEGGKQKITVPSTKK